MGKNILSFKFFFNHRGIISGNHFIFGFIILMIIFQGLFLFLNNQEFIIINAMILLPVKSLWVVLFPAITITALITLALTSYSFSIITIKRFRDIYKNDKKMGLTEKIFFLIIAISAIILKITEQLIFIPGLLIFILIFLVVKRNRNREVNYDFIEPKFNHYFIPITLWLILFILSF